MPSTTRSRQPKQSSQTRLSSVTQDHIAFVPLLLLVFVMWVAYRVLFHFPVWFDETLGKAVFFGLPVWLYLVMSRSKSMAETMSPRALKPGLLLGLAFGGIFGFAGTLISLLKKGVIVQSAPLFTSDIFWWEFFLAMMTGFWESLFFYVFVMTITQEKYRRWPLLNQVLLVSFIFLLFHIPNALLRFDMSLVAGQLFLLFFFGLGQAYLFARTRNLYSLMLSQAIWGMVLLVHTK